MTWLRLGQTRERRVVLPIVTAHFVNHQVQRGHDDESESTRARFPKGIARRSSNVAVHVMFEHQRVRTMRIVRRHLVAQRDVISRHQLLRTPLTATQQAVTKAQGIRRVYGDASSAVRVWHAETVAMQTVTPRPPP